MQLEIAISDMHLLCNPIFCECHNNCLGLSCLQIFANFAAELQEAGPIYFEAS